MSRRDIQAKAECGTHDYLLGYLTSSLLNNARGFERRWRLDAVSRAEARARILGDDDWSGSLRGAREVPSQRKSAKNTPAIHCLGVPQPCKCRIRSERLCASAAP